MKEPHIEDLASHDDPESCAGLRKEAGEALTGARAGRVLSRENRCNQGADAVVLSGRQHGHVRYGEHASGPARSKTPRMRGTFMRENREIPRPPPGRWLRGTRWKGRRPQSNDARAREVGQARSTDEVAEQVTSGDRL